MVVRAVYGSVFIVTLVFSITYSSFTSTLLFFILSLITSIEIISIFNNQNIIKSIKSEFFLINLIFISIVALQFIIGISQHYVILLMFLSVLVQLSISTLNAKSIETSFQKLIISFLLFFLSLLPLNFFLNTLYIKIIDFTEVAYKYDKVLMFFIFIWLNDTFAYLIGKKFGKKKLSIISPNKTLEGLVGGMVFTVLLSIVITLIFNKEIKSMLVMSFIVSIFGPIGDLIASLIKRKYDIKNFSNLIPGHGGVLDRLDSSFFCIFFVYLANIFLNLNV